MGDRVQVPAGGGEEEARLRLWIPFNLYRVSSGGIIGMDSSLWRLVSLERRPLLARPLEDLTEEPGPCRAPVRVSHREQLGDLEDASKPVFPGFVRRLIEVTLVPFRTGIDPVEKLQSARLAAAILELKPEPVEGVAWLPLNPADPMEPYRWLARREARLRGELARLASACEGSG